MDAVLWRVHTNNLATGLFIFNMETLCEIWDCHGGEDKRSSSSGLWPRGNYFLKLEKKAFLRNTSVYLRVHTGKNIIVVCNFLIADIDLNLTSYQCPKFIFMNICTKEYNANTMERSYLFEISSSHGGEYDDHPWWWRQHVPLKRRSTIILHGSTSQKTILNVLFVVCMHDLWSYSTDLY
jgi:hypothetical protein